MTNRRRRLPSLLPGLLVAMISVSPAFAGQIDPTGARTGTGATDPGAARGPDSTPGGAARAPSGLQPGIQYEEALAHASDRIAFTPGGRVTTPFRPRAGDGWPVGGHAPRALPAGNASGVQMAASGQGSTWSTTPPVKPGVTGSSYDTPTVDPSTAVPATGTSMMVPPAPTLTAPAGSGLRRQVFGFLPYWQLSDPSTTLHYDLLSTIAYFSVGTDGSGNLQKQNSDGSATTGWAGWTSGAMTTVIQNAHAAGTRVVLTVTSFAWTTSGATTQGTLLGSATARANLAAQIAAAVRDRGADGVNLDFEPIATGYADGFTALVQAVRSALDAVAPGYQLTFDATGYIGNYPIEAATAPGAADAIFIMGYDYRGGSSSTAGSIDPLGGPMYDLNDTISAYTARVPASKLILGLPYYGRAWSTSSANLDGTNISGTEYSPSVTVIYDTAATLAAQYGRLYDPVEQTPWFEYQRQTCTTTYGCVTAWRQVYYDDAQSLGARYDMINLRGLRGAGIWALGYDGTRPELWATLAAKFQDDTTAPIAGIVNLPATESTETFTVAWTGIDDRGIVSYDTQVSVDGGPWRSWLAGTTATSASYAGANGHGFAFRVRARDAAGNVGAWGVATTWTASPAIAIGGFGTVAVSSLNVRSGATTSASIVTTAPQGTLLAITGGPVAADGYTWWQVTLPIASWAPVAQVTTNVWIAAASGSTAFVTAAPAPNTTTVTLPSGAQPDPGATYTGIAPVRLLDTRVGNGLSGAFTAGVVRTFQVAGRGGVPVGAVAVTGNLTITAQTSAGWVAIGPTMTARPGISSLNAPRGDNRAASVTVPLAGDGTLAAVYGAPPGATTQLVFDVTGYFMADGSGSTYAPLTPARILDTRYAVGLAGTFAERTPRTFQVAGLGGVPSSAVGVTGNLTITQQTSAGYLALGPSVSAYPSTSTLNAPVGDNRANGVTVPLGSGGTLSAVWVGLAGSRTQAIFDVTGYFMAGPGGRSFHPITPIRLVDSRTATGIPGPLLSRNPISFAGAGLGTIPVDAAALTGTLTITQQTSTGFLALGPTETASPPTSTLNAPLGDNRSNGVTVGFASGGMLGVVYAGSSGSSSAVILDATGYFR